jgi:hypothetical protein
MVKLFNERDLDFYNPKPYLLKLISYLDIDAVNHISYYLDDDRYDYLFAWPQDASEDMRSSKRNRIFVDNVLDIVKSEHLELLSNRIISKVQSFESNIEDNIKYEIRKLQEKKDLLQSLEKDIIERTAKLEKLNAILREAQQTN